MNVDIRDAPAWAASSSPPVVGPAVGDLWTLVWEGRHVGVVLITRVLADHIVGMPVTDSPPTATELPVHWSGTTLAVWPQAETGLGLFLLHRKLGSPFTPEQVLEARRWNYRGEALQTLSPGTGDTNADNLESIVGDFGRLCFIEWPSPDEASLDVSALGLTAREFHEATGLDVGRIVELWDGLPLTGDERRMVRDINDEALTWSASGPALELSAPVVKDLVLELSDASGLSERDARNSARNAYALAARTDSVFERQRSRAEDTLRALIEECRAS